MYCLEVVVIIDNFMLLVVIDTKDFDFVSITRLVYQIVLLVVDFVDFVFMSATRAVD